MICELCGKDYDDYHAYRNIEYYEKGNISNPTKTITVCPECQYKETNNLSNKYYFINHLPGFVDGQIGLKIFKSKVDLLSYIDNMFVKDGYKICLDDDTVIQISEDNTEWWVMGYCSYKEQELKEYPRFKDIRKLKE